MRRNGYRYFRTAQQGFPDGNLASVGTCDVPDNGKTYAVTRGRFVEAMKFVMSNVCSVVLLRFSGYLYLAR